MSIEKLIVEKYKSFKQYTEVGLRGLTILSGANSSGKSSVMQPILLLKQTLHAGYDPGPLLLSGPNVIFSETDQMLWAASGEPKKTDEFRLGLEVANTHQKVRVELLLKQHKGGSTPLKIKECIWTVNDKRAVLQEDMKPDEIEALDVLSQKQRDQIMTSFAPLRERAKPEGDSIAKASLAIRRSQVFLVAYFEIESPSISLPVFPSPIGEGLIEEAIRKIIHVPGLRGNPRRTYPVTAVEDEFPGLFQEYVASIIASWQRNSKGQLEQLGKNLSKLGLTWKVNAKQKSDTEVEILVGRLDSGQRGGSRDLVRIADVGFGMSQSLPVVVALLTASPGQLVYLEQPEIHLHPRAQVALAELIRDAVERGVQVVVETHSELLLLGIQKLVAQGEMPKDKAILHWLDRDNRGITQVTSVEFDEQGALGQAPIDFSDVSMNAMREYLDATISNKGR